ncbi:hypothetical protein [Leptospira phage LE3]|uniref:Uncharacterized protein n=1 Tax=Leptospira phage LE3 TaxID=2041382 RepID=A0A343LE28_9CAUD|nr:hypothetical protein HWB33_gp56 [Leptospira phage LE3]ATN94938.1 hypothetical protein [Leptospira phage LE3]
MKEAILIDLTDYDAIIKMNKAFPIHFATHRCFVCGSLWPVNSKANLEERCQTCFMIQRKDAIQVAKYGI